MPNLKDRFHYFYLPKYHWLFLRGKPNVVVNSIQKAGTHMLVNALADAIPLKYNERGVYNHALVHTWPEHKVEKNADPQTVIRFLKNDIWPGEMIRGHIEFDSSIAIFLKANSIPQILIIRRPLDVLLSLANWWERHSEIPVLAFQAFQQIKNQEERLLYLLTGSYNGVQIWPNFIDRFSAFENWLRNDRTLVVRYEDLVSAPESVCVQLAEYLPLRLNESRFLAALKNKDNRTFTSSKEKVYKQIPLDVLKTYYALGGEQLEKNFGYAPKK